MAASILFSSIFIVSFLISQKIGFAPRSKNALTVDEKVKEGTIISSPASRLIKMDAISNAVVPEVVSSMFFIPNLFSNCSYTAVVYFPSPDKILFSIASNTYFFSNSVILGLLNLITFHSSLSVLNLNIYTQHKIQCYFPYCIIQNTTIFYIIQYGLSNNSIMNSIKTMCNYLLYIAPSFNTVF